MPSFLGGAFDFVAAHPAATPAVPNATNADRFTVVAVSVVANLFFNGYPGNYSGSVVIRNLGNLPLEGLRTTRALFTPPQVPSFSFAAPTSLAPLNDATATSTCP